MRVAIYASHLVPKPRKWWQPVYEAYEVESVLVGHVEIDTSPAFEDLVKSSGAEEPALFI